jgi:diguanylate cyclase (GGDEF)-like protein
MNRGSRIEPGGARRRRDDLESASPMRVLVVEDDFLQALAVQNLILEIGEGRLEPVLAPSLESAMERIINEPFDVVLLDLMLPDAQGLGGLERIVQVAPRLPVVVLTGLGKDELVARAFETGAQDYLIKGDGDGKELLRAIRHAIRRKASELRRLERARSDPLTGLANREVLVERIDRAKGRADREQRPFALLFLDLDGFKAVNDTAGHAVGDRVLQAVARRLTAVLRRADTVARLGGDEFVLLAEALHVSSDAAVIARKTLASLTSSIVVDKRTFAVGGSIGISVYPDDAGDPGRLINLADAAMYRAKQAGKNRFAFVPLDVRHDLESVSSAPRLQSVDEGDTAQLDEPSVVLAFGNARKR